MSNNNFTENLPNLTAYTQTEQTCRDELSQAHLNIDSFKQNRQRCSLSSCHGMCCHHGVFVNEEMAEVIQKVVEEEADFFKALGLELPKEVIIYEEFTAEKCEWQGLGTVKKTAVKEKPFSNLINDFPEHFENTACVFLLDDSRCGLQILSEAKGLHPWYYKPFTCWLFPIFIAPGESQREIFLPSPETEPWYLPDDDYDGFYTQVLCGKHSDCGQLGYILLQEELNFLAKIVGRNFVQEIQDAVVADSAERS
ncbi:DUF3109 family protein [Cylindrospermopsis raciborskii]|uniref:DUF3109 family protein n=1 Tax=Cylindrospermopsis raciborskii CENA302 TaxID=1170768 RepID=A0A9Q5QVZ0_9CYAN|nr:DUF3109 family protein [Cylindrospermopsis raciborskii]OPH09391.1 hypothetical protein CENA302_10825 [Cylindrospermopsis raciborskii CENA302]